jgi:hypothetical protein
MAVFAVMRNTVPTNRIPDCSCNSQNDRRWLEQEYLPQLVGRVLYVGVSSYTTCYWNRVPEPEKFETIDLAENRACFGSPFRHYVGNFLELTPACCYDHIALYGLFEHPWVTDPDTTRQIIEHADRLARRTVLFGPRENLGSWEPLFHRKPLSEYTVVFKGVIDNNLIWWGSKLWAGYCGVRGMP